MDIKKRANQIAHRFQSRNPFEIVRGLNVILVDAPLSGVRGFYQYFQRNHIIYLDETLSEQERTLVLAHELGHLFLHKKANAIFMDTRTHLKTENMKPKLIPLPLSCSCLMTLSQNIFLRAIPQSRYHGLRAMRKD